MDENTPLGMSAAEVYEAYLTQEREFECAEAKKRNGQPRIIDRLTDFLLVDDEVQYTVHYRTPIRRVRRITGYFTTIEHFNDAKLAELNDRQPQALVNAPGGQEPLSIEDAMRGRMIMERELAVEGYAVSLDMRELAHAVR